jgi:hypothetical protein
MLALLPTVLLAGGCLNLSNLLFPELGTLATHVKWGISNSRKALVNLKKMLATSFNAINREK